MDDIRVQVWCDESGGASGRWRCEISATRCTIATGAEFDTQMHENVVIGILGVCDFARGLCRKSGETKDQAYPICSRSMERGSHANKNMLHRLT